MGLVKTNLASGNIQGILRSQTCMGILKEFCTWSFLQIIQLFALHQRTRPSGSGKSFRDQKVLAWKTINKIVNYSRNLAA